MANKRQLKKNIKAVCGDLAAEILIARNMFNGFDNKAVESIVCEIAELQVSTLARTTFAFDKDAKSYGDRHAYNKARAAYNRQAYNKLSSDFKAGVLKIVKDMNASMPQELRQANAAEK